MVNFALLSPCIKPKGENMQKKLVFSLAAIMAATSANAGLFDFLGLGQKAAEPTTLAEACNTDEVSKFCPEILTGEKTIPTCLVDNVKFINPLEEMPNVDTRNKRWHNILNGIQLKDYDLIFWSPLGGTIGYCDCLKGNAPNIQKELDPSDSKFIRLTL